MKTIKVKNFQSHKDTQLSLHENVNIIVGQSSSGKTAIFRAIEWLNTNRPLGTRFITHGEQESRVTIDDITGVKTDKGKTNYKLLENVFDAGSSVPLPVTQTLNLSELNIQNQLDEHFLITNSPGEVARTFNRILNIEKVDEYISKLTKSINIEKAMIDGDQERIEVLKNNITELNYLDELNKIVSYVESRVKLMLGIKEKGSKLAELIVSARDLEISLFRDGVIFEKISGILKEFSIPIEKLKKLKNGLDLLTKARELHSKTLSNRELVNQLGKNLKAIDYSKLKEIQFKTKKLQGDINQFDAIAARIEKLMGEKFKLVTENTSKLKEYETEIQEFKTCPICRSQITDVNHIMEEVKKHYEIYTS